MRIRVHFPLFYPSLQANNFGYPSNTQKQSFRISRLERELEGQLKEEGEGVEGGGVEQSRRGTTRKLISGQKKTYFTETLFQRSGKTAIVKWVVEAKEKKY